MTVCIRFVANQQGALGSVVAVDADAAPIDLNADEGLVKDDAPAVGEIDNRVAAVRPDSQISRDLSVDYSARKYIVRTRDTEPPVECARTPGLEHSSGRKPDWRRCHDEIVGYCILHHPIRRCPGARGIGTARRWHPCRSRRCTRRLGWSLSWHATSQEPWWLSGGRMGRTTLLEGWPLVWVRGRARGLSWGLLRLLLVWQSILRILLLRLSGLPVPQRIFRRLRLF